MKGHFFLISLLPIPENLGLKKYVAMTHDDILHFFVLICSQYQGLTHSVHCPLSAGGKVEIPTKFSKRGGGLGRTSTLERVAGKEEMTFFTVAMQFSHVKN